MGLPESWLPDPLSRGPLLVWHLGKYTNKQSKTCCTQWRCWIQIQVSVFDMFDSQKCGRKWIHVLSINTGCSVQGRRGEEQYTKKWHVCWGGGNVKKGTSKSVFQPSEIIMWNLSKACVLCQNVFHALCNISGKFSVKVGGKIMWGWPTSPYLMLITACTCLNIQYMGTC